MDDSPQAGSHDEITGERSAEAPDTGVPGRRVGALVAATAMVAALVGGVVGAGLAAWVLDGRDPPGEDRGGVAGAVGPAVGAMATDGVGQVARTVLPSVVRIDVRGIGVGASGEGAGASGNASGIVWDDAGHIVTNHHVVAGATAIAVTFADGSRVDAALLGSDPSTDLAVLHVGDHDRPVLAVADQPAQVGQLAVVLGSPLGLDGSVSAGVISAVDRPVDLRVPDGSTVRLPGVLQTDAGISPGSSGGPLVDGDGRLIGIVSALLGQQVGGPSVGFAVPAPLAVDVVTRLIADGEVPTAWLGLIGTAVAGEVAAGVGVDAGVVVEAVASGSPAEAGGLQAGDVVVAVDDRPVRSMDDLALAVRRAGVGGTLGLTVSRDGAEQVLAVSPGERPDDQD